MSSTFVRVDPARLVADGDDLDRVATGLASALTTASGALGGGAGMAGDDDSAEEFAPGYDEGASTVLAAVAGVATALSAMDAQLVGTARAYAQAEAVGALSDPGSVPYTVPSVTSVAAPSVPGALGPGLPGKLGEFQEFLEQALSTLGVRIPTGDAGALRAAGDAWTTLSGSLAQASGRVSSSLTAASSMDLPQLSSMTASRDALADKVDDLREGADALGEACTTFAQGIDDAWERIAWMLGQLAAEIALDIGIGAALTALTGGIAAVGVVGKVMLTVMRWARKIADLVQDLRFLAQGVRNLITRVLPKLAKHATSGSLAAMGSQSLVNVAAPDRLQLDGNVLAAGGGAFVGTFAGGFAAHGVSRLPSGSAFGRTVRRGEGAVDGVVDSFADAGTQALGFGEEFSPLSALAGGVLMAGVGPGVSALKNTVSASVAARTSPAGATAAASAGSAAAPSATAGADGLAPATGDGATTASGATTVAAPS